MNICKLGLYEKAMPDTLGWADKLLTAKNAGFDMLEISIDESDARLSRLEWDKTERQSLLSLTRETGIYINSMCLSAHRKYPLGSADKTTERRGLQIMEQAVNLAYDLGIRIIQLAGYDVYYELSTPETVKRFDENLAKCVDIAASAGMILGFETMETPFMNTVEKAMHYVGLLNSPYLKIYPDAGNLSNGAADLIADIEKGRGYIVAAHLKETAPGVFRDMRFGEGCVDFAAVTNAFKSQGVRLFTAEFWHKEGNDYKKELKHAHDFLRKYL